MEGMGYFFVIVFFLKKNVLELKKMDKLLYQNFRVYYKFFLELFKVYCICIGKYLIKKVIRDFLRE